MDENASKPPKGRALAFWLITVLVGLRAASEVGMMSAHGSDPQVPIWLMFMTVKLALWLGGGLAAWRLAAVWKNRWGSLGGWVLLFAWAVAICTSSWDYQKG